MTTKTIRRAGRSIEAIIGVSPWARQVRAEILRVAAHDSNVLITGPTGTGKELIARAIHAESARAEGPLVPVDCAGRSGDLFTSHMFGHLRGAFTGAHYAAMGAFRAADGGTVFLDEIGELDGESQAKLLRVIQEKTVIPLGSHQGTPVDARIITATNRDLSEDVRAGRFREDLYYRLNVVSLKTVALKERPEDIEALANHFLCKLTIDGGLPQKRLSPAAMTLLLAYPWPGNVRELQNELERAVIFTEGDVLRPDSLPRLFEVLTSSGPEAAAGHPAATPRTVEPNPGRAGDAAGSPHPPEAGDRPWPTLAEVERHHIRRTLEHTLYNQSAAARLLSMDRHALRRKMRSLGVELPEWGRVRPGSHRD